MFWYQVRYNQKTWLLQDVDNLNIEQKKDKQTFPSILCMFSCAVI